MADDLIAKCSSLCLEDDENDFVDLGGEEKEEEKQKIELMLVGRLVTGRPYNADAFRRTMEKVWMPTNGMVIRAIAPNLYVFQFFHWRDKEKALKGRPWCWENNLLILEEVTGNEQPEHVSLNHSPFWVRVCNVPFNCRSTEDVKALTANIGEWMEVEEDLLGLERYRRVRVMMDVRKPLRRHQWMKDKKGSRVKVEFKYERLPFFCFACGIIGHSEKDCMAIPEDERNGKLGWGMFLRASPRKGYAKEKAEITALAQSRKKLFVTKENDDLSAKGEENMGRAGKVQIEGGEIIRVGDPENGGEEVRREEEAGHAENEENSENGEENRSEFPFEFRAEKQKRAVKIRRRVGKTVGESSMEVDEGDSTAGHLLKKRLGREEGEAWKEKEAGNGKRLRIAQQAELGCLTWMEVGEDQPRQEK